MMNIAKPVRTVGNILTNLGQKSKQTLKSLLGSNQINFIEIDDTYPLALAWTDIAGNIHSGVARSITYANDELSVSVRTSEGDCLLSENEFPQDAGCLNTASPLPPFYIVSSPPPLISLQSSLLYKSISIIYLTLRKPFIIILRSSECPVFLAKLCFFTNLPF